MGALLGAQALQEEPASSCPCCCWCGVGLAFLLDRRIWALSWCSLSYTPASFPSVSIQDNGDGRLGVASPFQRHLDFSFKHWMEKLQEKKYLSLKYLDYKVQKPLCAEIFMERHYFFIKSQKNTKKMYIFLVVTTWKVQNLTVSGKLAWFYCQ